jgi:hypothetical protein
MVSGVPFMLDISLISVVKQENVWAKGRVMIKKGELLSQVRRAVVATMTINAVRHHISEFRRRCPGEELEFEIRYVVCRVSARSWALSYGCRQAFHGSDSEPMSHHTIRVHLFGRPRYTLHICSDGTSEFFDNGGRGPLGKVKSREEKEVMIEEEFDIL